VTNSNEHSGYRALSVAVADGIATVTIDHPPINLFDMQLYPEMTRLAAALAADEGVRVVVLRSANPEFFIAHFDVSILQTIPVDLPPTSELNAFHQMCEAFRTMPKATIAVIDGRVGGGGSELALSCDMRFALLAGDGSSGAVFNQPEVALGIIPGGSGTVRLSRLIGRSRSLEVMLGCDDIDAATAEQWGWVNRALPVHELWPFVDRLATRIASFPPHAVAAAKAAVVRSEKEVEVDLLAEGNAFNATLGHPDAVGAMQRFLDAGGQTREGELRLGELAAEI
jgi:enoyl-CoA hydratase/carnithine racemase